MITINLLPVREERRKAWARHFLLMVVAAIGAAVGLSAAHYWWYRGEVSAHQQAAARIHPSDLRRTVRAIEVFRLTGRPISAHQTQWDQGKHDDRFVVTLNWGTEALNRRINARVRKMMEDGLLDEVKRLHARGVFGETAREGLGYKQLLAHIEGRLSLDEAVEKIKIETRRFAKNQRTWIRRLGASPGAMRLYPETESIAEMCDKIAKRLTVIS